MLSLIIKAVTIAAFILEHHISTKECFELKASQLSSFVVIRQSADELKVTVTITASGATVFMLLESLDCRSNQVGVSCLGRPCTLDYRRSPRSCSDSLKGSWGTFQTSQGGRDLP